MTDKVEALPKLSARSVRRLQYLVKEFIEDIEDRGSRELERFKQLPSLDLALHYAGLAIDEQQKRFSHQRRIPGAVLVRMTASLKAVKRQISSCSSFDDLWTVVGELRDKHRGIGELYHYDTALRIGAYLGLAPDAVYVHAGVRKGARALGFPAGMCKIKVSALPSPLRKLSPSAIEDFLCIYKDDLWKLEDKPATIRRNVCAPRDRTRVPGVC